MTKFTPVVEITILTGTNENTKQMQVLAHPIGANLAVNQCPQSAKLYAITDRQSGRLLETFNTAALAIVVAETLNQLFDTNSTTQLQAQGKAIMKIINACKLLSSKEIKSKDGCFWINLLSRN